METRRSVVPMDRPATMGSAQRNDGKTYIEVGKLNGWPENVLRDPRCIGMIVDTALVPA